MSIGPRNGLFEDRAEAEVRDGIFEVGIQSLEGSHVRVRNVFHREGDSLFPLAKGSHRMPELIAVKNDQIPRLCDQLKMPGGFHRIVLEQLAD